MTREEKSNKFFYMNLVITYQNGKTETHIGVEQIEPIKNHKGEVEAFCVLSFLRCSRIEKDLVTRGKIAKMEITF